MLSAILKVVKKALSDTLPKPAQSELEVTIVRA